MILRLYAAGLTALAVWAGVYSCRAAAKIAQGADPFE